MKLDLFLYKNNELAYSKEGISTAFHENTYTFYLEDVKNEITLLKDGIRFVRESDEYTFDLKIKEEESTCKYLLKELDSYVDILVEDGTYQVENKKITLHYQLESDDSVSSLEIVIKE